MQRIYAGRSVQVESEEAVEIQQKDLQTQKRGWSGYFGT
jgi:hypothetical protein